MELYIDSNRATTRFTCPSQCSDIPTFNPVGCNYRYSDPVVNVRSMSYGEGNDTTLAYISWSPVLQYHLPSSHYFVMMSPQSDAAMCVNTASAICLMTNGTVKSPVVCTHHVDCYLSAVVDNWTSQLISCLSAGGKSCLTVVVE